MTNLPEKAPAVTAGSNNIGARQTLLNKISYPSHLPIVNKKRTIIEAIRKNPVVIITGETGSGKTTQIPKMCLEAGRGKHGLIGCTQPRRVAAIATANRIAEEMREALGLSVGYKIRFDDKSGGRRGIKIMTDGILLMETQADPHLNIYDTIIVDEAHERSLNIDFILGILKTLLRKRKNLKVIITSATIDSEKFSRFFGDAPVIEVSGRTYPVDVHYFPSDQDSEGNADLSDPEAAVRAVEKLQDERLTGDILIFMATERDVRETCEILKGKFDRHTVIMPLFARLPWSEQRRIFQPVKYKKIIVATNIAETSLTIPGVRYVIDPGTARISQYNPRIRTNSLPVQGISRSSADQRKGRCGRVAKGICIRLYSEEEYDNRPQFTPPEIMRSNLAGVILKMLSLQIGDIASFPFIDRPPQRSFQDGLDSLRELGAIGKTAEDASAVKLTEKGRLMARIPLDPRLSRMLIEARKEGCPEETAIIAAALSLPDPRERPAEKEIEADRMHAVFKDPASDFMTLLNIWKGFKGIQSGNNSRNRVKKYCHDHFLSYKRMGEWQDIHAQIQEIMGKSKNINPGAAIKDYQALYAAIHKSILSGCLSNIAVKKEKNIYQATRGREVMLFPGSGLFNKGGNWIVAAEIVETSRVFARMCANIECDWLEELGGELCRSTYSEPRWEKIRGEVVASEQVTLFGMVIVVRRPVSFGPIAPDEAGAIFIREALVAGEVKNPLPFQRHNQKMVQGIAALEDKIRRTDLLVPEEVITRFYEQRLPGVYNVKTLQKLIKDRGSDNFLRLQESDLLANLPDPDELALYPDKLAFGQADFPLVYSFAPGNNQDGVTVKIPLHQVSLMEDGKADWLVPGLLLDKVNFLLKGLPKEYRKKLLPLNSARDYIIKEMKDRQGHFLSSLTRLIYQRYNVEIPASAWPLETLPEHLRMRFAIIDEKNNELAAGRDISVLQDETIGQIQSRAFEDCRTRWERAGISNWDCGELPVQIELKDNHGLAGWAYPALAPAEGSVQIRLFQRQDDAERCHREGVVALFALHYQEKLKYLKKSISLNEEAKLWTKHLGGAKVIEVALYRRTLKNLFDLNIRTEEAFLTHADKVQAQILTEGQEVLKAALPILKTCHETMEGLRSIAYENRANRAAQEFLGYLRDTLARIAPPDFMQNYSAERLLQVPRYLLALTIAAQRGILHLDKAMGKVREMQLLVEEMQNMIDTNTAAAAAEELKVMDEYYWMVEEYRVSLFAQELKTLFPISRKKLAQKMHEIKMMVF
jgi:ATP-dependent helicase HrpA